MTDFDPYSGRLHSGLVFVIVTSNSWDAMPEITPFFRSLSSDFFLRTRCFVFKWNKPMLLESDDNYEIREMIGNG